MEEITLLRYAYPKELELMHPLLGDRDGIVNIEELRTSLDGLNCRGSVTVEGSLGLDEDEFLVVSFPFHVDETEQTFAVLWAAEGGGCWDFLGVSYDVMGEIVSDWDDQTDGCFLVSSPDPDHEICGVYRYEAEDTTYLLELEEAPF